MRHMMLRNARALGLAISVLVGLGSCTDRGVDPTQPAVPSAPTDVMGWINGGTIELWWLAQGEYDVVSFNVYRRVGSSDFVRIDDDLLDVPPGWAWIYGCWDQDVDLEPELEHCYYVTAVTADGIEGPPSEEVRGVLSDIVVHLQTVEGLIPPPGAHDVPVTPTFEWLPISDAASYCLKLRRRWSDDIPSWVCRDTLTTMPLGASPAVTYWPPEHGGQFYYDTLYDWWVFAVDAHNMAIAVGAADFRTAERAVPSN